MRRKPCLRGRPGTRQRDLQLSADPLFVEKVRDIVGLQNTAFRH
jgi:hypothetical protein